MTKAWRGVRAKLTARLFLGQWVGNLVLMVLAAVWLQIPDSHRWQFVFSMVSGLLLVIAFCWLYAMTFRQLRVRSSRPPHWRSWLWLVLVVGLWWFVLLPIAAGRAHEGLFAGYWNSQSPSGLRHHLGYSQLVAWQEHIYDCLAWLWGGLLLPLAIEICACGLRLGWFRRVLQVYGRALYWLCVLLFGLLASAITWALVGWTPDLGLAGQTFSVVARLGLAYVIDVGLWCFVLALAGYYLDRPSTRDAIS